MTPQDRIAQIKARAERATKEPWEVAPCSSDDEVRNVVSEFEQVEGGSRANWIAELDAAIDFDTDRDAQIEQLQHNAEFIGSWKMSRACERISTGSRKSWSRRNTGSR